MCAILYYFVATSIDHILHDSDACHMSFWHVEMYLHASLYVLHDIGVADHMETTRHHWSIRYKSHCAHHRYAAAHAPCCGYFRSTQHNGWACAIHHICTCDHDYLGTSCQGNYQELPVVTTVLSLLFPWAYSIASVVTFTVASMCCLVSPLATDRGMRLRSCERTTPLLPLAQWQPHALPSELL